jgi:hypothetical protein
MFASVSFPDRIATVGTSAPIATLPRAKTLLAIAIWGGQFLIVLGFALTGRYPHAMVGSFERLSMSAFGIFLCVAIGWMVAHIASRSAVARWIWMVVGAISASLMWSLFAYFVVHLIDGGVASTHVASGREIALDCTVAICVFAIWLVGCVALDYRESAAKMSAAHSKALADAADFRTADERAARESAESSPGPTEALWVPVAGGKKRVPLTMIEYLEADHDYVRVHATNGRHLLHGTLEALERELEHGPFLRVHRSFIINSAQISQLRLRASGLLEILLTSGACLPVGRTYSGRVRKRLLERSARFPITQAARPG